MHLDRTKLVLDKALAVLKVIKTDKDLIASYFSDYILIVFFSELEEKIKESLHEALLKATTKELSVFLSTTMDTIFKRIDKKNLGKTIKYFGGSNKERFDSLLDDGTSQKYINFIENRHKVAHPGESVTVSWEEVKEVVNVGEKVINAFRLSLGLKP